MKEPSQSSFVTITVCATPGRIEVSSAFASSLFQRAIAAYQLHDLKRATNVLATAVFASQVSGASKLDIRSPDFLFEYHRLLPTNV